MPEFQTNEYITKDIGEAAALITQNQKLIRMDRESNVCWFVFDNKKKCEELSNQFFFGDLQVNAREYYEAQTRLKNRIFSR